MSLSQVSTRFFFHLLRVIFSGSHLSSVEKLLLLSLATMSSLTSSLVHPIVSSAPSLILFLDHCVLSYWKFVLFDSIDYLPLKIFFFEFEVFLMFL